MESIRPAIKYALYRLIGLNARAARRLDVYLSRRVYRRTFGREPDLAHPTLFSEKIVVRKLFDKRPIFSTLADKLLARDFAAERIGPEILPKLHLVCERFEGIDFDRLPDKFVIKANHGSGWTLIVDDRKAFDRAAAAKKFRRWMGMSYYLPSREVFYRNIDRKIMVEEYLQEDSGAPAFDYRFHVFEGSVKFIQIRAGLMNNHYDRECRILPAKLAVPSGSLTWTQSFRHDHARRNPAAEFTFPTNMEEMFDIAGRLGRGFDYIRVDLYNPGGRILFGEMTSLPGGGARAFSTPGFDLRLGQNWHLDLGGP
jgi:hypothetical protein